MHIRSARLDEVGAVLDLWRTADAEPTVTDDPRSVTRLITDHPAALIVAEDDGALIGTLIASWDGWRGSMYRLAVRPDRRREGIARALVAEGERRLHARGVARIAAVVVTSHAEATGFWRSVGYEEQDDRSRFVKNRSPN